MIMIIWWSNHVGVILSILVCDIWINVLLQISALVGPLYIVYNLAYVFCLCFMLLAPCIFWHRLYQPKNALNNILFLTRVKLLRVFRRLPKDGTPVPNVGAWLLSWIVFYDLCFIVLNWVLLLVGTVYVIMLVQNTDF
jgi:hypothetical protein